MKVIIHTKKIFLSGVILSFVFLPLCGLAAGGNWIAGPIVPCGISNSPGPCTLCHLVVGFYNLFKWGLALLFTACILFITVAGVIYMVSSGNKALMDWAKKALLYSLTAFVLFLCSWLIVTAVMIALGYKQIGNWWTFTCDETAYVSSSSSAVNWSDSGKEKISKNEEDKKTKTDTKSVSYKEGGDVSPKAREVIDNYMNTQVGKKYGGDVHCWSTTNAAYKLSGLPDLDNRWEVWDGDINSIKPGCAMQIEGVHTFLVLENGATSSAPPNGYIGVNKDGLNYNLERAEKLGKRLLIIYPE